MLLRDFDDDEEVKTIQEKLRNWYEGLHTPPNPRSSYSKIPTLEPPRTFWGLGGKRSLVSETTCCALGEKESEKLPSVKNLEKASRRTGLLSLICALTEQSIVVLGPDQLKVITDLANNFMIRGTQRLAKRNGFIFCHFFFTDFFNMDFF
eukprot:Trichotokara_eunicae@DN1102_c0_g1_i1.p1